MIEDPFFIGIFRNIYELIFCFADVWQRSTNTGAADVHEVASDGPIRKMTPVTVKDPSPVPSSLV